MREKVGIEKSGMKGICKLEVSREHVERTG